MSTFAQFFSSGSGLYATPPKRITIAGFGGSALVQTYGDQGAIPCAAAAGTFFTINNATGPAYTFNGVVGAGSILLKNAASGATVASIAPGAVIGGTSPTWSSILAYDATARALYVGAWNAAGQIQLAKLSDTTGAVTLIGAAFTPTTLANWYSAAYSSAAMLGATTFLDGGNLVHLQSGVAHSVNAGTGVVNYQNGNFALADGTTLSNLSPNAGLAAPYITADKTAALWLSNDPTRNYQTVSFAKNGMFAPNAVAPSDGVVQGAVRLLRTTQYVAVIWPSLASGGASPGWRFFDPTDFDRYVHDLIFAIAGV
ncbi:MAG: hypothetical protein KGL35_16995 [Bradyrhizobium sp.]|nr:hypothetical protein [Bradyrhizobium sp.]